MNNHVIIVGAGIGGLSAALLLAAKGHAVTVLERAATPGGKMREVAVGAARVDAGPTVLTMRWIFEEIFAEAGTTLEAHLTLTKAGLLARHAWSETERLDLFADIDRSAEAIGVFAGTREAAGYRAFTQRARKIFETLDTPFIRAQRPRLDQLVASFGLLGLGKLRHISPFTPLWQALGEHFRDPRLMQLFGRYATYCGSSPYLAPATLMLVAHVEQDGVWLVENGMYRLAEAMATLATTKGADLRYGAEVREIVIAGGRARGIVLAGGERLEADAVIVNADVGALKFLGAGLDQAAPSTARGDRSLSAVTFAVNSKASGFPLARHNVFFSGAYKSEFDAIFARDSLPDEPTVYVCAQDRGDGLTDASLDHERLLCLVNAPPSGDERTFSRGEIARCETSMMARLAGCGLMLERRETTVITDPTGFETLFPATGGALYGPASHGWQASFNRAPARTKIPGLYLAGGSVHPGPGVPMAAISGRLAAQAVMADRASTWRSRTAAMPGGTSTR